MEITPKVAFDVQGTLLNMDDEETTRADVVLFYKLFEACNCQMFIWSGAGVEYAQNIASRLGLSGQVIEKGSEPMDIIIDDLDMQLRLMERQVGKVHIKVPLTKLIDDLPNI